MIANINLKRVETILGQICTIINYPKFEWSTNYIIEQTYLDLISATASDGITRIYEQQQILNPNKFVQLCN